MAENSAIECRMLNADKQRRCHGLQRVAGTDTFDHGERPVNYRHVHEPAGVRLQDPDELGQERRGHIRVGDSENRA
jgi:hypothetical protein